jgi:hypothetical protein
VSAHRYEGESQAQPTGGYLTLSGRTGVRPDSVQVPGGKLSMRLPTSVIGVALYRFAFPPGTAREVWLQRGLPSSQ